MNSNGLLLSTRLIFVLVPLYIDFQVVRRGISGEIGMGL